MQEMLLEHFFIRLLNIGVQVSVMFCILLLVRAAFSLCRAPAKFTCILWMILFVRLLLPVLPESPVGLWTKGELLPLVVEKSSDTFGGDTAYGEEEFALGAASEKEGAGIPEEKGSAAEGLSVLEESLAEADVRQVHRIPRFVSLVWAMGCMVFLLYGGISVLILKRRLRCSIKRADGCYLTDGLPTAFVAGVFSPGIYLPSDLGEKDMAYVILHERLHIRRGDHLVKAGAYFITCFYWFHPLVWGALYLLGRDIEMACDEAVIKELGESSRRVYADTLLRLSAGRKSFAGTPLAFGEGSTQNRISRIIKYKKPAAAAAVLSAIVLILLAVSLLTGRDGTPDPGSLQGITAQQPDGRAGGPDTSGHTVLFSDRTDVTIDGKTYDMADLCDSVNGVMPNVRELDQYIVIQGHISPNNSYYGFFNTENSKWEWGFIGTHLTWDENWETLENPVESIIYAEVSETEGVICDWKTNRAAVFGMEDEYIYDLRRVGNDVTITLVDFSGESRELSFDFCNMGYSE